MTPPIEFAHVPSRHKPARKRALLFWLAAAKLRQLLAEDWANEMWETRTNSEINAAIAAEREALND